MKAHAVSSQAALRFVDVMIQAFISGFGVLLELHSDQGCNVESGLFRNLCKRLAILKTRTTARWNGRVNELDNWNVPVQCNVKGEMFTSKEFSLGFITPKENEICQNYQRHGKGSILGYEEDK